MTTNSRDLQSLQSIVRHLVYIPFAISSLSFPPSVKSRHEDWWNVIDVGRWVESCPRHITRPVTDQLWSSSWVSSYFESPPTNRNPYGVPVVKEILVTRLSLNFYSKEWELLCMYKFKTNIILYDIYFIYCTQ